MLYVGSSWLPAKSREYRQRNKMFFVFVFSTSIPHLSVFVINSGKAGF